MFETDTLPPLESTYLRPSPFPTVFRLAELSYHIDARVTLQAQALLVHPTLSLRVAWPCDGPNPRLEREQLVLIHWGGRLAYDGKAFQIDGLEPIDER